MSLANERKATDFFALTVAQWRKDKRVKQSELAIFLGITQTTYSRIETAIHGLSLVQSLDIAMFLKISNKEVNKVTNIFIDFYK